MNEDYSAKEFEEKYTYEGNDLGVTFLENKIQFKVWAPEADSVSMLLYNDGDVSDEDIQEEIKLIYDTKGVWKTELSSEYEGKYYVYKVARNGDLNIACDPYAKAVGINGDRAMILNLSKTNPEDWDKDKNPFSGKKITDSIIYEMHVRDFTIDKSINAKYAGKFLGVCESGLKNSNGISAGMDYLKELGVTHIHLLPIADYGSVDEHCEDVYNWGYDPKNYNVAEGSYSTNPADGKARIYELKKMIKTLHDNGIAVIMDVVYNHTYETSFCMNKIVPGYFYRMTSDGEYSNGSGCGNDIATERSMVRKFIADSVKYWAEEYHMDGFRFDLMGLIDVDTMNAVRKAVDDVDKEIIMYGEGWDMKTAVSKPDTMMAKQENACKLDRIALFNDEFRDGMKGSVFEYDEKGYISSNTENTKEILNGVTASPEWADSPQQVINYVSCHDNHTLFDKVELANPGITFEDKIRQNKLAALILFTCQGGILFHSGEELMRTKVDEEGNFVHDSVRAGDKVNSIKWEDLNKEEYYDVYTYYKNLINFRKLHPSLRFADSESIKENIKVAGNDGGLVQFYINASAVEKNTKKICVIYNPTKEDKKISLEEGKWKICCDYKKADCDGNREVQDYVTVPAVSGAILIQ